MSKVENTRNELNTKLECEICHKEENKKIGIFVRKCPFGIMICEKCENFTDRCDYIAFNQSCTGKCGKKEQMETVEGKDWANVMYKCPKCGNELFKVSVFVITEEKKEKQESLTIFCNNENCNWHKTIPLDLILPFLPIKKK